MEPPPRPPLSEDRSSQSDKAVSEKAARQRQTSLGFARSPLYVVTSSDDNSPRAIIPSLTAILPSQRTRSLSFDYLIAETPSPTQQPDRSTLGATIASQPSPDELIAEEIDKMPRMEATSPGSTSNPRSMSQVSPGFIFVNFLSQSVCF